MAKDSKFLLHFNKLATFKAELEKGDSGVIDANYHVVFIKDAGMLWARGKYYADSTKTDALNEVYDQAQIKTADITATQITVTFTGKKWNSSTRTWDAITETIVLPAATNTTAGLQTALHRTKENAQVLSDYSLSKVSQNADVVTIESTRTIAPTAANGSTSTSANDITIPVATEAHAGVLTPLDKTKLNDVVISDYDAQAPTHNASNVVLNHLKTKVATTKGGAVTTQEDDVTINAATSSTAGVMSADDKTELDRIITANYTVSAVTPDATKITVSSGSLDIDKNTAVNNTWEIPAATNTASGLETALHRTKEDAQILSDYALDEVSQSGDTVTIKSTRTVAPIEANKTATTEDNNITIPVATEAHAGVLTPLDKTKINDVVISNYALENPTHNASSVTINAKRTKVATAKGGATSTEENDVTLNAATTTTAGVMTADDKTELDRITTANYSVTAVTPDTTKIDITAGSLDIDKNTATANNWTIPAATEAKAGVLSALDKTKLNDVVISNYDMENPTHSASSVTLNGKRTKVATTAGGAVTTEEDDVTINAATSTTAGVMTADDKTELDRITTANYNVSAVTPDATKIAITAGSLNIDTNAAVDDSWNIPAATNTAAGLETALHRTKENVQVLADYALGSVSQSGDTVTINSTRTLSPTTANTAVSTSANNITIPVATEADAGVLTPLDKTKLNDVVISNYALENPTHNTTSVVINGKRTKVATAKGGATSTEENDVTINAASTTAAGVMTTTQVTNLNTVKSYYDFVTGFSTVTAITSIPITYRNVEATISANATIGLASVPAKGRELHVIIKNSGSSTITVTLPNSGNYICTNEDKYIEIYAGYYGEVHLLSNGSKVYVRGVGQ